MKTTFKTILFASTIGLMALSTSCKKKGCTDETAENYSSEAEKDDGSCTYPTEGTVTLTFSHNVDGSVLTADVFDQLNYTTPEGNTYSVTKLQYLITDVRLYKASGDSIMIEGYHLVDLTDTSTLTYVLPEVVGLNPYTGIGFNYGFIDSKNISGEYADLNSASWSSPEMLGGGYHQLKFEGRYINDATDTINFQYHNITRTENPDNSTFVANDANIHLNKSMDLTGNANIEIKMNMQEWFRNPNTWDLDSLYTMLMPNYAAQIMMTENSYSVFSVGAVTVE
ncbi:hypothetical protein K6119_04780 [Paracrocinitomix mangrovi]|uniref:MbnP family protein n=1 Tax=Paracrocinitomix mangrovi TaxID=2862509 RepID=UPI001C8D3D3D|nr:MbnP family protein [Paracrocinitomix mangrovi]UKN02830.1 hypothetical protein K6119_04780 [Paracrocinitomix mangrovi]